MRKYCLLLIILFSSVLSYCQQNRINKKHGNKSIESLKKYSINVKSIDPANEGFSDLMPLKEKVGNSRLVVLGEDSHGDGETWKAKIRLVKFLHEQMGFDVIAWEFNYSLDLYINQALHKDSLNLSKDQYYGFGWDAGKPLTELISYTKKTFHSNHPILYAGFDFDRPPAGPYVCNMIYHLGDLNVSLITSENDRENIDSLSGSIHGFLGNVYSKNFSKKGYAKAVNIVRCLKNNFINNKTDILSKIGHESYRNDSLMMESVLMDIEIDSLSKIDMGKWNSKRDEYMAKRINWLIEKKYRGEKIIIWSATAHLIRNSTTIKRFDSLNVPQYSWTYKQAGDYLAANLGSQMYTIAFTSYEGQTGDIMLNNEKYIDTLKTPELNSYEDLAHKTNQKYLFTDLKNSPAGSWLSKEFLAYPLGYNKDQAQWKRVIDAFFFIDEMKPVEHRPLKK